MENQDIVEQPIKLETLTEKLTYKAIDFIETRGKDSETHETPFALYMSYPNVHTPLIPGKSAQGKSNFGPYGDSLYEMDDSIGQILDVIDKLGMTKNTLVYFTSDHGSQVNIGKNGGSNFPFRGE